MNNFKKNRQYLKFCAYGFLKNLRFFDAFLLLFFLENGLSFSQIGILYAVREITINVTEVPSGIISDTYGRKNSLIGAFLIYIASFAIFYFSDSFYLFFFAIVLYGLGDAFRSGTHKGMIMDYLKLNNWEKHKVEYYGHTRSWSQKGSAISALLAGILVLYTGSYKTIFLFSIIPYLMNLINIYSYPNELNFSKKKTKNTERLPILAVVKNFFSAIRKPRVFQIINSSALHSAYLKASKDYIQPMMVQVALLVPIFELINPKNKTGLVVGIVYFFIFLLTSYASKNAHRINQLPLEGISQLTLLSGLCAGALCGLLFYHEHWILSLLAFIAIYLLENIRKPILTGELAENVPNEILTSVLSAQSFFRTIMTALIAILLGIFADHLGIGFSLVIVSGCLFVFSFIVGKIKMSTSDLS